MAHMAPADGPVDEGDRESVASRAEKAASSRRTPKRPAALPLDAAQAVAARVALALAALLAVGSPAYAGEAPPSPADIEKAVAAIADYDLGKPRKPLLEVEQLIRRVGGQAELTRHLEQQLLKALESPASPACQVFILQQLWIIGSDASVPALAKRLLDEKTAHMACYAFGRSPSPQVGKALRDALPVARGLALQNAIAALADRRDAESVEALAKLAASDDAQIADAAVGALGRISGEPAARVLAEHRKKSDANARLAATLAYLQCAEGLAAQGKKEQAAAIYEELFKPGEPKLIRRGALVGLTGLGGEQAVSLVLSVLRGSDPWLSTQAIAALPALKAPGAAEQLAAELPKLPLAAQALLVVALAERGDPAARPAIVAAVKAQAPEVRAAALDALGKLGDAADVPLLATLVGGPNLDDWRAAGASLRRLRGQGVDEAIVRAMRGRSTYDCASLLEVLRDRGAKGLVPAIIAELGRGGDPPPASAFRALGWLALPADIPALIDLLVSLKADAGRTEAELAVVAAAKKIPEVPSQAEAVLAALAKAKTDATRASLVRVLGGIANADALRAVRRTLEDRSPLVHDAAVRALADWPAADAADSVLRILKTADSDVHRILALRGYVRLLNLAGSRPVGETVKLYAEAMSFARRPDDKKLVLAGLGDVPAPQALKMAMDCLGDDAVKAEAALAALRIARAISATHRDEAKAAMARLAASTADAEVRKQAESVIAQGDQFEDYIVAWQVAGPYLIEGKDFKELFDIVFPPEKPDAKDVAWRALPTGTDPARPTMLDLKAALGGEQRCAYVRTWVFSEKALPARIELGCDDGNKVWLNGQLVHSKNLGGKAIPGSEKADVVLKAGWNSLLIKITQATGPWEFCLRFRTRDGARVDGLRADCLRRE